MATTTILQLPQALSLTGAELVELAVPVVLPGGVQGWASERGTTAQFAALIQTITGPTGVLYAAPAVGANNDYNAAGAMGPSIGFLELTPTANCNLTGLKAGLDGQVITVTNLSLFNMTLNSLNSGSQAANQFRMVSDFSLVRNDSKSFKYSATIGKWIAIEF